MEEDGTVRYRGLNEKYSGYMNRAVLSQSVPALDLRCMSVRDELKELYEEYTACISDAEESAAAQSAAFSREVRRRGYLLIYSPADLCYTRGSVD